jgi:hypothetical protein
MNEKRIRKWGGGAERRDSRKKQSCREGGKETIWGQSSKKTIEKGRRGEYKGKRQVKGKNEAPDG